MVLFYVVEDDNFEDSCFVMLDLFVVFCILVFRILVLRILVFFKILIVMSSLASISEEVV